MHGFESLVAEILETEGYWVRRGYKVELTKGEKRAIGRPSSPRWEIDLLAYDAAENTVLAVECKSYLDSPGVDLADLRGGRYATRYKLFTEPKLRRVVFGRLAADLHREGLCPSPPTIQLALAAGRLRSDAEELQAYFEAKGWWLFDPQWIRDQLRDAINAGYTDSVAVMTAKILLRGSDER